MIDDYYVVSNGLNAQKNETFLRFQLAFRVKKNKTSDAFGSATGLKMGSIFVSVNVSVKM